MKKDEVKKLVQTGIDQLNTALKAGHTVRLKDVMKLMARFHKYSFNNCVLIAEQCPDATKVLGFHGWKAIGRSVKKGEKGIGITAPLAVRKKDSPADEREVFGFRVVHVFDISQTEGDDLPKLSEPTGDVERWIGAVERLIASRGITLKYGILDGSTLGFSSLKKITVLSGLKPPMRLEVLVHELAHEILHPDKDTRKRLSNTVMETEAQAVAQIVGQALGVEGVDHSAEYIHLHRGNSDVFADSMKRIQKCSSDILKSLFDDEQPLVRGSEASEQATAKLQPSLAA